MTLEEKYHANQAAYAKFGTALKAGKKVGRKAGSSSGCAFDDLNGWEVRCTIGAGNAEYLYIND